MADGSGRTRDLRPQLRLVHGADIAIGPGKADLLEHIRDTGSISAAGRAMGMSYKRAWLLVSTMNRCFTEPLVAVSRGGSDHGGAALTQNGERVLAAYRRLVDAISDHSDNAAIAALTVEGGSSEPDLTD